MVKTLIPDLVQQEHRLVMSYDEWLAWEGEDDGRHAEWVKGKVIVFMPPTDVHQGIVLLLSSLLNWYVQARALGRLIVSPFEMRLEHSAREPDILFIAQQHLDRLTSQRLVGPADVVIELISPDSVNRDRVAKFDEYEAAGIPEYWLFDPRPGQQSSQFFQLGPPGRYDAVPLDADGRYHSAVITGFWLRPEWLWQETLPNPLTLMWEIAPDLVTASRPETSTTPRDRGAS